MKTKFFIFVFTLFFTFTIQSQYISSYKTGLFNGNNQTWLYNNTVYSYYSSLQLNQVIKYGYHMDSDGSGREGGFFDPVNTYQPTVSALIGALTANNQQVFIEREKILRPAYGQQSDYQAEMTNPASQYPGYGWETRRGQTYSETWQGEYVSGIYLTNQATTDNSPNWVLENLYENWEQINQPAQGSIQSWGDYTHAYYLSDNKLTPSNDWKWYVLPRMRIREQDATGQEKDVITIEIKNYQGTVILSQVIKTTDFLVNGQYNGQYIDKFSNVLSGYISILADELNQGNNALSDGRSENPNVSGVDYKIYWHGQVNVWIDRVRVEDEWAHFLFDPSVDQQYFFVPKIVEETGSLTNQPFFFYQDEFHYNMVPCQSKVNQIIRAENPNNGLISLVNDWWWSKASGLKHAPPDFSHYVDKVMPPALMVSSYPFDDYVKLPPGVTLPDKNTSPGTYWYTNAANKEQYNTGLQNILESDVNLSTTNGYCTNINLPSHLGRIRKAAASVAGTPVPFVFNSQVHVYEEDWKGRDPLGCKPFVSRDQTAPEMGLMPYLALCYGAKQISYWWLPSFHVTENNQNTLYNNWGLLERTDYNNTPQPRYENYYGEQKWNNLIALNQHLNILGNALFPLEFLSAYSVHNQGANHGFITDILSIDPTMPQGTQNPCTNDYQTSGIPYGPYADCPDERYWEMGFFSTTEPNTKYFMAVNRRCVSANLNANPPVKADDRLLRVKFDGNDFLNFTNWRVSEVGNNYAETVVFSKYYQGYIDLGTIGYFGPGKGKLFKIEAVPVKGGTLVADEVISGETFTCEAPVYNNGFDITIEAGTTIHFNDSSRFVMNGGVFTVGNQNVSGSQNITNDAVNGTSWIGHSFTNCEVKIYGANFTGITNDTAYSLNIVDCPVVDIRNCTFNNSQSLKGAVNAVFYNDPFASVSNVYLFGNTFNSSGSTIPTVNISSYAGLTLPLIIEGNTFNNGNTAIFLTGVTGGAIKGNTITDNYYGLNVLTSSVDIFENTISSSVNGSIGVFSAGGSEVRLNKAGSLLIGGQNTITNTGSASNNIKVEGAVFLLADGENIFDIASNQSAFHLYGWFPYFTAVSYDETDNCFKVDNSPIDPPVNLVTDGYQGSALSFTFQPYLTGCEIIGGGDGFVINLGDGIYDTLYNSGSGSGGSLSSALPLDKGEYPQGEGVYNKPTKNFVIPSAKKKYDSISVLLRYRNYSFARTKCFNLINTYPDSIQSLNAISKLFLASTASDTTINGANELKIFYENLILNHPNNVSLVKRANYFILKCKVRMRQYSQALAGFQQIINQNPYSYEGLIARWDYMATSLLAPQGGSFGSELTESVLNDNSRLSIDIVNALQREAEKEAEDDDKSPFTKEQRKDIRKSINTAIDVSKNNDETKMKTLEEKSELGDLNASKELSQMKSLKQVVKTEKPKSITQHIKVVSEDIRKVFGSNTSSKGNQPKNLPTVFRISQNYPNPFNPTTKINYDLPKDSKVNIVIYDILGREVKRLVNNELKTAGSYIVDFNTSNYASGVYFYRIEAEEQNGNKFVDSKKMVLLK